MMKAIAKKPSPDHHNKKPHNIVHGDFKNSRAVSSNPQTPLIQLKPICPCDGGCPRCAGTIQTKLKIGQPNDIYEQEADRVAEQVMQMPETSIQHQSRAEAERRDRFQGSVTTYDTSISEAPPIVHEVLNSPGQPLDVQTRAFFEPRFGHDFSHVRVHFGEKAAESARAVNANAYTVGGHIVFAEGRNQPTTDWGMELIAHELAHVVQQGEGTIPDRLRVGDRESAIEREAEGISRAMAGGAYARISMPQPESASTTCLLRQEVPQPIPPIPRFMPGTRPGPPLTPVQTYGQAVGGTAPVVLGLLSWVGSIIQANRAQEELEKRWSEVLDMLKENPGLGVMIEFRFKAPRRCRVVPPMVRRLCPWSFVYIDFVAAPNWEWGQAYFNSIGRLEDANYDYQSLYMFVPPLLPLRR